MEINYEITEEECIEARKILDGHRSKVYVNIVNGIFILYIIVSSILYEQSIFNKIINIIWPVALLLILEFFVLNIVEKLSNKLLVKKVRRDLKIGKQKLVILDKEIRYSSDLEEYTFYKDKDWITIYNIHKYLYIVITNETSNVIVVPKDKVPGESIDAILKLGKVKSFGKNPS
ncbi:MAG: hypothetical protein KIC66_12600 [Clostridium sp.]|uniref:hypothetical protein n=1 Tax=Clostridium sp. TaxID=1506 RepID=UPI0025C0AEE4|nr:hypothetical protein [Clostridium sp.]MBS5927905.1 hypothetical protein [Clostridium sp.]